MNKFEEVISWSKDDVTVKLSYEQDPACRGIFINELPD